MKNYTIKAIASILFIAALFMSLAITAFATTPDTNYITVSNDGRSVELHWFNETSQNWASASQRLTNQTRITRNMNSDPRAIGVDLDQIVITARNNIVNVRYGGNDYSVAVGETLTLRRREFQIARTPAQPSQAFLADARITIPNIPQNQLQLVYAVQHNRALLESLDITVPHLSEEATFWNLITLVNTSYDFSHEAILARIAALEVVFPDRMMWGTSTGTNCQAFTQTVGPAVRGRGVTSRVHTHADQLRVSDIITIQNSSGAMHSAFVVDISDTGVITIAEGNIGGRVGWGRTFTMAAFSANRGHNSVVSISSIFDANGDVMYRYDELGRTILREHCVCCPHFTAMGDIGRQAQINRRQRQLNYGPCGVPTGFTQTVDGITTVWNLDGTVRYADAVIGQFYGSAAGHIVRERSQGASTPVRPPAAPAPAPTPAPTPPPTPAQVTAQAGTTVVTNDGTRWTMNTTSANGRSTSTSTTTLSNGARGTRNGIAWSVANNVVTLTVDGRTYTVAPGETLTIVI